MPGECNYYDNIVIDVFSGYRLSELWLTHSLIGLKTTGDLHVYQHTAKNSSITLNTSVNGVI